MNDIFENNITLNKETHEYKLDTDPGIVFTSVTTYVDKFFEGFDAQKIATKLVNNHPKYFSYTVESLIAEWNATADHGTKVHNEIEEWIKEGTEPSEIKAINGKDWLESYKLKSNIDVFSEVIIFLVHGYGISKIIKFFTAKQT